VTGAERGRSVEILSVVEDPATDLPAVTDLGARLAEAGLTLRGRRVLPAEDVALADHIRQAAREAGLVLALGDREGTAALRTTLSRLTGSRLVLNERALQAVTAAYAARGRALPPRAEALALMPQSATVLLAAGGDEPGILAELDGTPVVVLPAAAALATAILIEHVLPRVAAPSGEPAVLARTLRMVALDPGPVESVVAEALRGQEGVTSSWVAGEGELALRLRVRAASASVAQARWPSLESALRTALGLAWYGDDEATLEGVTGGLLRAAQLTVALAESCTGGLVGHRLTQVPGSSAYVDRGFVVYSNAAKEALLGVPVEILKTYGAVSAPCVEAMARGARARAGTALGVGVTGIAGPDGGTPTKPVGTVFVGLADAEGAWTRRYRFDRDRAGNKALSATAALDALRRYAIGGLGALDG
jgi:nicotinamide-nucleotide amidase